MRLVQQRSGFEHTPDGLHFFFSYRFSFMMNELRATWWGMRYESDERGKSSLSCINEATYIVAALF